MRTHALAALALLVAGCTPARALTIRAVEVTPAPAGASFAVTFSAPLKLAAEEDGPAYCWDEFQFVILPHDAPIPRTIVRGGEIPCAGAIPVRATSPPDTSACAGGWGPELDAVPYVLTGATVRFVVPWESLGNAYAFPFAWRMTVTRAGSLTDERRGESPGLLVAPARTAAMPASWGAVKVLYR